MLLEEGRMEGCREWQSCEHHSGARPKVRAEGVEKAEERYGEESQ
jgi:hypothetical protein